jgi:branched-chain amino acid aminotransferase
LYLFFNQTFLPEKDATVSFESKAFRYGELVFETIRLHHGKIPLLQSHFERLQIATKTIGLALPKHFSEKLLEQYIQQTAQKNKLSTARIRVTVFGGSGGLFENKAPLFNILIETYPLLPHLYELNTNGLDLCIYTKLRKQADALSSFKNGNFLLYNMAAQFCKQQKCNEALILNTEGKIIETTISNLFIIKNGMIYTPPITDGCVAGVMRKYIMESQEDIVEKSIILDDILSADELFLTNATRGIQWVKQIDGKNYDCRQTAQLWTKLIQPLNN